MQGATAPLTQLPAPQHEEPDFMHPGLSVDDVDAVATSTLTPEAAAAQKLAFLKLVAASKELTPDMTVLHLMAAACDPDSKVRHTCSMISDCPGMGSSCYSHNALRRDNFPDSIWRTTIGSLFARYI